MRGKLKLRHCLGILIATWLVMDGLSRLSTLFCVTRTDYDFIVGTLSALVKKGSVYKVVESEYMNTYVCTVVVTEALYKAIAYNACGRYDGEAYRQALITAKLAFKHPLLVMIDKTNDVVALATFTHSQTVLGGFISGYTKYISELDLKLENRAQYLSETFLSMNINDFETYLRNKDLILDNLKTNPGIETWLGRDETRERLASLAELNQITERLIEKNFTTFQFDRPKIKTVRFDGQTGDYQINNLRMIKLFKKSESILKKLS